jgi:hypothetical protein
MNTPSRTAAKLSKTSFILVYITSSLDLTNEAGNNRREETQNEEQEILYVLQNVKTIKLV